MLCSLFGYGPCLQVQASASGLLDSVGVRNKLTVDHALEVLEEWSGRLTFQASVVQVTLSSCCVWSSL